MKETALGESLIQPDRDVVNKKKLYSTFPPFHQLTSKREEEKVSIGLVPGWSEALWLGIMGVEVQHTHRLEKVLGSCGVLVPPF